MLPPDGHEDEVLHAFSAAPALTFSVIEDPLLTLLPFTKLCSATYPLAVLELYTYTIVTLKLSNLFFAEVSLKPTTSGTFTRVSLVVGGAVTRGDATSGFGFASSDFWWDL